RLALRPTSNRGTGTDPAAAPPRRSLPLDGCGTQPRATHPSLQVAGLHRRPVRRKEGVAFFLLQREEERTRDPAMRHRVLTLLRAADVGIADFRFDKEREDGDGSERVAARMGAIRVRTLHQAKDGPVWFDLRNDESLGTQELFFIAVPLLAALEEGTLLVIDEVLSALHPNLIRLLVDLVHRSERGQLLMATHETSLLDSRLMRRDQIYFVEKDANGASHLYSLLEFKPRKDEHSRAATSQDATARFPFLEPSSSNEDQSAATRPFPESRASFRTTRPDRLRRRNRGAVLQGSQENAP